MECVVQGHHPPAQLLFPHRVVRGGGLDEDGGDIGVNVQGCSAAEWWVVEDLLAGTRLPNRQSQIQIIICFITARLKSLQCSAIQETKSSTINESEVLRIFYKTWSADFQTNTDS